jgi:transposase-like protein
VELTRFDVHVTQSCFERDRRWSAVKKFRHYSYDFKVEAVRLLKQNGKTLVEQAGELGIDHMALWM